MYESVVSDLTARPIRMGSRNLDKPAARKMAKEQTSNGAKLERSCAERAKHHLSAEVRLISSKRQTSSKAFLNHDYALWRGDVEEFLINLPKTPLFDLVLTSPPYNLGKEYEDRVALKEYWAWQKRIIALIVPRLKPNGSLCWQVGNFVNKNEIFPLDIEFAPLFKRHHLRLRNRIIWRFGHGLHTQTRFSGRYEVVMWYTKSAKPDSPYTFNLDAVRIPAKYPGKRHYKGPNSGKLSGNPLGKNPEDVWDIPNVKSNHVEKTIHPCQFPVGLVERLILALTKSGDLVFDPFAGSASTGVGAAIHGRRFWGCEIVRRYAEVGRKRIQSAINGKADYRPHTKPVYDHTRSTLSHFPEEFLRPKQ